MMIETERLILREMTADDFAALTLVWGDAENMRYYPYRFDEARVRSWIQRNQERYRTLGFGLWALCLKETGEVIGDCGLTMQPIDGEWLPEIGYHLHKDFWRQGYAKEAAGAVRDWAFQNTDFPALYSYMTVENVPSSATARSIGLRWVKDYTDPRDGERLSVYRIQREEK